MPTYQQAIELLKLGNQRFLKGKSIAFNNIDLRQPTNYSESRQAPFAVILGCSDSRVPAEIIFDQGLGELFVIRIAGNIVASSQIGSIEFATTQLGCQLVVVLGHSHCGAVQATLDYLHTSKPTLSNQIMSIIEAIRPAVEPFCQSKLKNHPEQLLEESVKANTEASVRRLREDSVVLKELIQNKKLQIIGAHYQIATGEVIFLNSTSPLALAGATHK